MTYDAHDWHKLLRRVRDIQHPKFGIPGAQRIGHGPLAYYTYQGSQDPEYAAECQAWAERRENHDDVRERVRARRAAKLFTEMWERRRAGESLDDIERSEVA